MRMNYEKTMEVYVKKVEKLFSSSLLRSFEDEPGHGNVRIANTLCRNQVRHMHNCIEIIFVVKGSINVRVSFNASEMHEGEYVVINFCDLHTIEACREDAVISCIHLSPELFELKDGMITWNLELKKFSSYDHLCTAICSLITANEKEASDDYVNEAASKVADILKKHFMVESRLMNEMKGKRIWHESDVDRFREFILYFYAHYNERVTLDSLAEEFALGKYYLSHYMKLLMGYGFHDLLNSIRCDMAEVVLLESGKSIGEISENFGFSSPQYFNRYFTRFFGASPKEYRAEQKENSIMHRKNEEVPVDVLDYLEPKKITEYAASVSINFHDEGYRMCIIRGEKTGNICESRSVAGSRGSIDIDDERTIIIIEKAKNT